MTQVNVLKLLQKNKRKWFSTVEISKKLKVSKSSITKNLNKLFNQYLILKKERGRLTGGNLWKAK